MGIDGTSIADFLTGNIVVPIVVVVGIAILFFGFSGNIRKAAVAATVTLIGFFVMGMASHSKDVGGWLYGLIF